MCAGGARGSTHLTQGGVLQLQSADLNINRDGRTTAPLRHSPDSALRRPARRAASGMADAGAGTPDSHRLWTAPARTSHHTGHLARPRGEAAKLKLRHQLVDSSTSHHTPHTTVHTWTSVRSHQPVGAAAPRVRAPRPYGDGLSRLSCATCGPRRSVHISAWACPRSRP
jgi:hypothetical protein